MAKVLIIDDDEKLRRMMSTLLTRASHEVVEASDGIEGMRRYHEAEPDVVVSDIVMPHRDGIETIWSIRETGKRTPVVAISGGGVRGGELYLTMAEKFGADVVVQKPFRAAELVAAVDKALEISRNW